MTLELSDALVALWHEDLMSGAVPREVEYLREVRGLSERTLARYQIGWDGDRLTIPIRDAAGALINVRRYRRNATAAKMISVKGYGSGKRLAFLDKMPKRRGKDKRAVVIVTGGEWDALVLRRHGFVAVTPTSGEGALPCAEDLACLAGWPVRVLMDTDQAGRLGAANLCQALEGVAADIKDVVLPLPKDATNWFVEHKRTSQDLIAVMRDTPRWSPRRAADGLLATALTRVASEPRNSVGFWLSCQLRDERYSQDEAWSVVQKFQQAVERNKAPYYSAEEARSSLTQAFSRNARQAIGHGSSGDFQLTDMGNAERLVAGHGDDMRWVEEWRRWAVWDGARWRTPGGSLRVEAWAKQTARSLVRIAAEAPDEEARKRLGAHAARSESAPKVKAMVELAKSEPDIAIPPSAFDRDPWLLNCPNGTLDLRTGKLQNHARADMCSRMTTVVYDTKAKAPTWEAFLLRVLPDPNVRAFVQRAVGYSLTGMTSEQKLLLLYGFGANGKTTFCETVKDVAGDYGQQMPFETLLEKRNVGIPNDVARLNGARFVLASESRDGDRFDEQLVKQLTGGDTMTARFLHAEFFDFRPQCTIWLRTNHRPVVRGTDDAIWRRFLMVPFEVQIPEEERDDTLLARLRDELPGVLAWAVEGCLEWQRDGLMPPAAVTAATEAYRNESDVLGSFFEDCCSLEPTERILGAVLFDTYRRWAKDAELVPMSRVSFGKKMKERGFEQVRIGAGSARGWNGVSLTEALAQAQRWRDGEVIQFRQKGGAT